MKLLLFLLPFCFLGKSQAKGVTPKTRAELTKEFGAYPEVRKARFQRISEKNSKQLEATRIESRFSEELATVDESVGANSDDILEVNKRSGIADHLYQGDIILSEEEMAELERDVEGSRRRKRQAATYKRKWTDNTLYFFFTDDIEESLRELTHAAHKYIHDHTCINFVENGTAKNVVRVYDGNGCAAEVGMTGGIQRLSLSHGCYTFGTVAHEFIHALGFYHEQSRADRDQFITLNKTNIDTNELYNFQEIPSGYDQNYTPYEYGSVMHYSANLFAKNSKYLTMVPKEKEYLHTMGQKDVSFSDILKINAHYACNANCNAETSAKCQNGGYPNPRNCSACNCPRGFAGDFCDQRPSGCGETLVATSEWQVSLIRNDVRSTCTSWITAPKDAKIEVELNNMFNTLCKLGCSGNGIEIKGYDQRLTNPIHCCKQSLGTVVRSSLNPTPVISFSRIDYSTYAIRYRYVDGPAVPPVSPTGTPEPWNCKDTNPWLCEWTVNSGDSCEKKGIDWAVANCPKTCGYCDSVPINTFPPTTDAPSTTTERPSCEDKRPDSCAQLTKQGITCEQLQASKFAGFCNKTCGICMDILTTTVPPTIPCEDKQPNACAMYFNAGRTCEDLEETRFSGQCNKSCGLCNGAPTTTMAPKTTKKTTTAAPTTTEKPCEDEPVCKRWFQLGRTCEELKEVHAEGACNKTCGLCGTTSKPTTKSSCVDKDPKWCTPYVKTNGNCNGLSRGVATTICPLSCGYCA